MEKIGDIYWEKKKSDLALKYFQSAKKIDLSTKKGNYILNRLRKKIDKITGLKSGENHFQNITTIQLQKHH